MAKKVLTGVLALVLFIPFLLACGRPQATPTPTPAPTDTPSLDADHSPRPPAPTSTLEPTPTQASVKPLEITEKGLLLLDHAMYRDGDGRARIIGQVYYGGPVDGEEANVSYVTIQASLYDQDERLLEEKSAYAIAGILRPGDRSPFSLTILDPPAGLDTFKLQVTGEQTGREPALGLEIAQHVDWLDDGGNWTAIGEVINNGDQAASWVQVAATLYDASGNIANVGSTSVERTVMPAGSISPFEVFIGDVNRAPARYEIAVFGEPASESLLVGQAELEMQSTHFDDPVLVGEVRNAGAAPVDFARVVASFYDANDRLVAVEWDYVWHDTMGPGAVSPFKIDLQRYGDAVRDRVDHWVAWVEGAKSKDGERTGQQGHLVLEGVDAAISEEGTGIRTAAFTGTVKNEGPKAMKAIQVAVTAYDAAGEVIAVDGAYLAGDLAAGAAMPFTFEVRAPESTARFQLYVQGQPASRAEN
jgi:hypothetical protein